MDDKTQNIDLQEIDWKDLSLEEFSSLSKYVDGLSERVTKSKPAPKGSKIKTKLVILSGITYEVTEDVYIRLKSLKSEKSKQNLIKFIRDTAKVIPVEEL